MKTAIAATTITDPGIRPGRQPGQEPCPSPARQPAGTKPLPEGQSGRKTPIEGLRLLAAFGVVWFHMSPPGIGKQVSYAGLEVFLLISAYFCFRPDAVPVRRLGPLLQRLILPWLTWMIIYGILSWRWSGTPLRHEGPLPIALLAGTSIHLWYVPYIFVFLLLSQILRQHVALPHIAVAAGLAATGLLLSNALWQPWLGTLGSPYAQWLQALPASLVGVALGCAPRLRSSTNLLVIAFLGLGLVLTFAGPFPQAILPYPLALLGVLIAVWLSAHGRFGTIDQFPRLKALVDCTFGIYLIHVAIVWIVAPRLDAPLWLLVPVVFCLSGVVVLLLRISLPRSLSRILF